MAIPSLILTNFDQNNSNACFANSIVHFLRHVPPFVQTIHHTQSPVEIHLTQIFANIGTHGHTSLRHLRTLVGQRTNQHNFYDGTQQDAMEFLMALLQSLHPNNHTVFNFKIKNKINFYYNNTESPCQHCGSWATSTTEAENLNGNEFNKDWHVIVRTVEPR